MRVVVRRPIYQASIRARNIAPIRTFHHAKRPRLARNPLTGPAAEARTAAARGGSAQSTRRRRMFWRRAGLAIAIVGQAAVSRPDASAGQPTVDYQRDVHPILAATCLACHSQEKRSGGLSLATYADALEGGRSGAAIDPGRGAASLLVQRITGDVQPAMPLGQSPLSAAEVTVIRSWIDEGARATTTSAMARRKWEAPLMLERPALPPVVWANWSAPVDRFVSAYLVQQGVRAAVLVSDAVFARRVYLDIWGLLPPPGELQAFLRDTNHDKRRLLVETLLDDGDKYAE